MKTILETEKSVDVRFQNEFAMFKNKCEKLIALSYENNLIRVENLDKEMT